MFTRRNSFGIKVLGMDLWLIFLSTEPVKTLNIHFETHVEVLWFTGPEISKEPFIGGS